MQENNETIERGKRLTEVDVLKGMGILLMVAGHMHFSDAVFNKYVYAFHMPAFFLISGYLYRKPVCIREAFLHKAKSLLVPYFIFAVGYEILWIVSGRETEEIRDFIVALLLKGTDGIPIESALWFLLSSFIVYVCFVFVEWSITSVWMQKTVVVIMTLTGCIITPILFDRFVGGGYGTAWSALGFFI